MTKRPTIDQIRKKLPERERRYAPADTGARIELRAVEGEDPKIGMFVPFNSRSVELFGFTETIAPGAFTRTIKNGSRAKGNGDIIALWNHDPLWVLGRQANQTLELRESETGLEGEVTLDGEDGMHRHFARRVERGDVQGTSFGFETVKDEWEEDHDAHTVHRTLVEVKLFDVSPVTFPAYPQSEAEARAAGVGAAAVALARAGTDLGELADVLQEVHEGKIPRTREATLRTWLTKLEALLPLAEVPPVDWARRLELRERLMRTRDALEGVS